MYRTLRHIQKYGMTRKPIYRFGIWVFLYAVVNGITSYILPLFLSEVTDNLMIIGFVLASSSIWNILTDLTLGFSKKSFNYIFLVRTISILSLLFFLGIKIEDSFLMLVLVTFIWGIYTELYGFSLFNFVESLKEEEDGGLHFGLLGNFFSLGSLIAPIIAGMAILISDNFVLNTGLYFVFGMILVFNLHVFLKRMPKPIDIVKKRKLRIITELKLWRKIGAKISPILTVFLANGMSDGATTSFVPLFAMTSVSMHDYGGFIVASFYLPVMLLSGYFGHLADKYGRKKFILVGLLLSFVALGFFGFSNNYVLASVFGFLSGLGFSLYNPSLMAIENVYISKHLSQEKRVISEGGIFYNIGFILGACGVGWLVNMTGSYGIGFGVFGVFFLVALGVFWKWGKEKVR